MRKEATRGQQRWLEAPWALVACVSHTDSRRIGALALASSSEGERTLLCPVLADAWKGKGSVRLEERGHVGWGAWAEVS